MQVVYARMCPDSRLQSPRANFIFLSNSLRPAAGGSGWFNARDDCGEVLAQGQCFRVFDNAASLANVQKFINQAVDVLGNAAASDDEKFFALAFIHSWVKDGAFEADSATFVADAEAAIAAAVAADASAAIDGVTFTAKYEVATDEGFHLDIIKQWFAGDLAPHGWRFSCRNRNSNVQGKKTAYNFAHAKSSKINFRYQYRRVKGW